MDELTQKYKREYLSTGDPMAACRFANSIIRSQGEAPPIRQGCFMTIPTIGTQLELADDWTFTLYNEYRNQKFWEKIHPDVAFRDKERDGGSLSRYLGPTNYYTLKTTLPAGTLLKVSRIYIRQGVDSYDSLTFSVVKHPTDKKIKGRFWVKLDEVNQMFVNWETSTLKGIGE